MSKIIDISAARRRRDRHETVHSMANHQEKRRETRRPGDQRIFVQIISSPDSDLVGTTITCRARDVSASGLQIETDTMIPQGAHLDLWVDKDAGPGKFFLSSVVRWSYSREGAYYAGVELHRGAATDIDQWQSLQG